LLQLARIIRAASGDARSAAEILGAILGDPGGSQLVPPDPETIHAPAQRMWGELPDRVHDEELVDARRRGSLRTVDVGARELLADGQSSPGPTPRPAP
jgi:hypothetical protein